MLNRVDKFLEQCLSGIPEGRYSARLRKELEGHLAALEADLTDAALLRNHFRLRKDRRGLVTAGLLMTWTGEKAAVLLVSSLLYGIPLTALPELVGTMARDSDFSYNLPWFSAPYCVWTLFGCLLLGRLFGGVGRKKRRQAA